MLCNNIKTPKYCYNVVFLFHCFLVLTVENGQILNHLQDTDSWTVCRHGSNSIDFIDLSAVTTMFWITKSFETILSEITKTTFVTHFSGSYKIKFIQTKYQKFNKKWRFTFLEYVVQFLLNFFLKFYIHIDLSDVLSDDRSGFKNKNSHKNLSERA